MNEAYQQFHKNKEHVKNVMKEDRASITLEWYHKIQEMLQDDSYSRSSDFLENVLEFIEEKEYISDKQIDICEKIYNHPDNELLPF